MKRMSILFSCLLVPFSLLAQITETKLTASDGATFDLFGYSVSISGDYAIVGAHRDVNANGDDAGSAYIFKRDGANWIEKANLTASDGDAYDEFGFSVSISGDYAIVGATGDDDHGLASGSAYIFKRDGDTWTEEAKLTASAGAAYGYFGNSVSISGDYALIGAYRYNDNGFQSGSAYVFKRDGDTWTEEAKLIASDGTAYDEFGFSVSISGDYAIVGAQYDDDNGQNSGSAYIFNRAGITWTEETKLIAGGAASGFAKSVSISDNYAIIGAPWEDDNGASSGSAYIFRHDGVNWTEESKLTASDGAAFEGFGYSVSLSGDYAVVGAHYWVDEEYSGSAYIFTRNGVNWTEETKLTASDGATFDSFGYSVSISDGYALIGAYGDDDNGTESGSAYVYSGFSGIFVTIAIDPLWLPIPAAGDTVPVNVTIINPTSVSVITEEMSVEVLVPGGKTASVIPTHRITIYPYQAIVKEKQLRIPGEGPPGTYTLTVHWDSLVSSSFEFEKSPILLDNGSLVNNPGGGVGGADESVVQTSLGMSTHGFNHDPEEIRVADDFTIPTLKGWTIDSLEFYAYQTFSGNTSTITTLYYRVWDGPPDDPGSTVIFGDLTTNRLIASTWSNIYRVVESTSGSNSDRPVMKNTANAGVALAAGTYWIEWATEGTLTSGPWAVPITISGQTVTGDALQYSLAGGTWSGLIDGATSAQQGLPFVVYGTVGSQSVSRLQTAGSSNPDQIPTRTVLEQNYPNPFNPSTTIRYALPEKTHVKLEVFNMLGQSVAVLVDGEQGAGYHSAVFEGAGLASGVYVYRLSAGAFAQTKRLLLLR